MHQCNHIIILKNIYELTGGEAAASILGNVLHYLKQSSVKQHLIMLL